MSTAASFLTSMASASRERAAAARQVAPEPMLRERIAALPPPAPLDLRSFLLIAEVKRVSPAAGPLEGSAGRLPIADRVRAYAAGGAGAISVLTEPTRFSGSLADLTSAAQATRIPVMRKDFLVDPYQLVEARAAGAAGVLLITRMLPGGQLLEMLDAAGTLGLFTLVESFDRPDLDRSAEALARAAPTGAGGPQVLLGVNARDLTTLRVTPHPDAFEALAPHFPPGSVRIGESGVESTDDAHRLGALGYHGALVGSALMLSPDPQTLCRELLAAGRAGLALRDRDEEPGR